MDRLRAAEERVNHARYRAGQRAGHYESFFQRANHPERPLAFWIRYTLFSPHREPERAIGELWAIVFDGETGRHVAVKRELPMSACRFARDRFLVTLDDSRLDGERLSGSAESSGHRIGWELDYASSERPLFLFPLRLYDTPLPKAKSLVGVPMAIYDGKLTVDDREIEVRGWKGSQNHNWGSKHTDHYAWGQVAGFDDDPDAFLEVATARLKLGPVWTPFMSPLVVRHRGEELSLNSLRQAVRARGSFDYFDWHFSSEQGGVSVEGRISAPKNAFVGLRYGNPPGGDKHCLNSKIASCELTIRRPGGDVARLSTRQRAAFEILTDDRAHGVAIVA